MDFWWKAKTRRPNQKPRKEYKKRCHEDEEKEVSEDEDIEDSILLDDWDEWLNESEETF